MSGYRRHALAVAGQTRRCSQSMFQKTTPRTTTSTETSWSHQVWSGGIMGYRALRTTVAIAWCFAMAIPRAEAQLAPFVELQPGTRVRIQAPGIVPGRLEGTVVARTRDSVTLTRSRGAPIPVPLAGITAAEVSRGRSHRHGATTGLAWGASVGLAVGMLSAVTYDARSTACGVEP